MTLYSDLGLAGNAQLGFLLLESKSLLSPFQSWELTQQKGSLSVTILSHFPPKLTLSKAKSSCVWAPQCRVDNRSALFSYFSNDGSDFSKAIKMCSAYWANSAFQSGFLSRLRKQHKGSGDWRTLVVQLLRKVYQETQIFLILNQYFLWFQQWFSDTTGYKI